MDQTQPPAEPNPLTAGNGAGLPGQRIDDAYQPPDDHELSPEVQLAWFELNREQIQRMYFSVMRMGGLIGAIVTPLLLVVFHYIQVSSDEEMVVGLPQLHENPATAAIYWLVIGVPAGFLIGVGLAAVGFNFLQRFR